MAFLALGGLVAVKLLYDSNVKLRSEVRTYKLELQVRDDYISEILKSKEENAKEKKKRDRKIASDIAQGHDGYCADVLCNIFNGM